MCAFMLRLRKTDIRLPPCPRPECHACRLSCCSDMRNTMGMETFAETEQISALRPR